MPKPLPHHWRKLTSHKLSSANDVGQASTIPRNNYVVTVKNYGGQNRGTPGKKKVYFR